MFGLTEAPLPHPLPGNSNPFCRGSIDNFWNSTLCVVFQTAWLSNKLCRKSFSQIWPGSIGLVSNEFSSRFMIQVVCCHLPLPDLSLLPTLQVFFLRTSSEVCWGNAVASWLESTLTSGLNWPCSCPCWGHCVVSVLLTRSVSLYPCV